MLRVALVQAAASLDPAVNRQALAALTAEDADLVVFPEAFARDFGSPDEDLAPFAETLDGPFAEAVADAASARSTTVVAGMFESTPAPARPTNTLVVRGRTTASYRKIHLYDSFGYCESDRLTAGPIEPTLVELDGWKIGLMTCYDLRFPELARALVEQGAEVLVVPAAWVAGERKVDHWRTLLTARAIENTVYVAAAAQPAPRYCGHSLVVDPRGDVVVELGAGRADAPEVARAVLRKETLDAARRANPSLANRRM